MLRYAVKIRVPIMKPDEQTALIINNTEQPPPPPNATITNEISDSDDDDHANDPYLATKALVLFFLVVTIVGIIGLIIKKKIPSSGPQTSEFDVSALTSCANQLVVSAWSLLTAIGVLLYNENEPANEPEIPKNFSTSPLILLSQKAQNTQIEQKNPSKPASPKSFL